jgi:NADH:ubiquinone oxidoreductase subunit C
MLTSNLKNILPIVSVVNSLNEIVVIISHIDLLKSFKVLKNHINYQYNILSCISGVDYINCKYRFGIVYDILSLKNNDRLRVKIFLNETTPAMTLESIYINSN